ncbi:hypothetical protein B7494_g1450 [Chlorociboria aeruginascens]|nr:hypothetical protein B7494_g1450 [Chlorociboria aeruginascens]
MWVQADALEQAGKSVPTQMHVGSPLERELNSTMKLHFPPGYLVPSPIDRRTAKSINICAKPTNLVEARQNDLKSLVHWSTIYPGHSPISLEDTGLRGRRAVHITTRPS